MRRVAFVLEGSRGDSQPYVAAAKALQSDGFSVLIIACKDVENMVEPLGTRQQQHFHGRRLLLSPIGTPSSI